ncbi:hypothetical protein L2E82_33263 [Cichorium intybus]|uniref:Uncharacterized protein n=1 Tax=Cichorium intybus TaxID=13427 RepID=A0ACB9BJN4_CICIN|nr:hypothetical protein L2E82_33263 [Cichorium intybus]
MDEHLTNSEIIPMNQGFMASIQNDNQLQVIHNDSVGMNPEFEGGFQYQNHLQMIQRNLEGFQNPGFIAENQQLLSTSDTNVIAPKFIFGQDHAQLIQNDNSTTGFDSLSPRTTVVGSGSGSRQPLSKEAITQHFNKPLLEAAKELNVGSTQLKNRCRELGIPKWPRRQLKSLETLINNTQELNNIANEADVILGIENEKKAIFEGSSSKMTDTTKKFRQAVFRDVYRKRKAEEMEETSSGTHAQQQSLPSGSAIDVDLLGHVNDEGSHPIIESMVIPILQEGPSQIPFDEDWSFLDQEDMNLDLLENVNDEISHPMIEGMTIPILQEGPSQVPSNSYMSGFNPDFLKIISEEKTEDLTGDIACFQRSD